MRQKIKDIINKDEGFTLVELLAVIVILAIIVAIAVPAIGNITERAESNASDAEQELIIDAARLYDIENKIDKEVTVKQLVSEGFLDVKADKTLTGKVTVERTGSGGTTYKYVP